MRALLSAVVVLVVALPAAAKRPATSSCQDPAIADGTYIDLDIAVQGARWITLRALNERGDIVGSFEDESASVTQSFLLRRSGEVTVIAVPGATRTWARDINASGTVVGTYQDASGLHAFTWRRGVLTLYPRSPSTRSLSFDAINASGAIAGSYGIGEGETAFVQWRSGTRIVDVPDRPWDFVASINDRGDVLLISYRSPGPGRGAYFLATKRGLEPVVGCGGLNGFTALLHTVTTQGSLVGREGTFNAFWGSVYSRDGVTRFDYPGASSTELVDMNSAGSAIGHATVEGELRVFLFVPQGRR